MESYGKFYSLLLSLEEKPRFGLSNFISSLLEMLLAESTSNMGHCLMLCNLDKGERITNLTQVWQHVLCNLQCKTPFQWSAPPCPHPLPILFKKKNHRKQKTTTKNSEVRNKETLLAHNSTWLPNSERKLNSEILQAFKYHSLPLKHVYEEKNLLHHIQEKAKNFKFKTNIILS